MGVLTLTTALALMLTAAQGSDVKIHAKTAGRIVPVSGVYRSPEELAKAAKGDPDKTAAALARAFKVESIDWKKQMVIVIVGEVQRTGGYTVEVSSMQVKDDKLNVSWKVNAPTPGSIVIQVLSRPAVAVLVDRFDGNVEFNPKVPAGGK